MTTRNLNRNLKSKSSNKFYTKFLGLDHNSANILGRQVMSVERPSINFTAVEHRNKGGMTKHTTVAELEPITIEFRDDIAGNTIRSMYDIIYKQAAKTQSPFEIKVAIQDHNGIEIEGYTLKDCFIQNIAQNQLTYMSTESSIITATIYYHNVDYTSTFEYDDKTIFDGDGRWAVSRPPSIYSHEDVPTDVSMSVVIPPSVCESTFFNDTVWIPNTNISWTGSAWSIPSRGEGDGYYRLDGTEGVPIYEETMSVTVYKDSGGAGGDMNWTLKLIGQWGSVLTTIDLSAIALDQEVTIEAPIAFMEEAISYIEGDMMLFSTGNEIRCIDFFSGGGE